MATTTNYGWATPDDTALVKDGASAIRTLGSSVDTTTKALNPSTTLGDIEYRSSTANTNTRLAIGTTGQILTVAGGVPSWATAGATGFPAATTYTPTVTASSGSPTSVTATGNYSQSGKYVICNVNITVNTVGTASGAIVFTLPIAAKSGSFIALGLAQEVSSSGAAGNILVYPAGSTTTANIRKYDFTSWWVNGYNPCGTIIYEVA
jgi:hypothetical protein